MIADDVTCCRANASCTSSTASRRGCAPVSARASLRIDAHAYVAPSPEGATLRVVLTPPGQASAKPLSP
ncbi:hypothetical protein CFB41_26220 [Burkholderia sp. AU33803]|nr:hypothetical protein CFB41_26220 [Burkholderia sp. AU33803]